MGCHHCGHPMALVCPLWVPSEKLPSVSHSSDRLVWAVELCQGGGVVPSIAFHYLLSLHAFFPVGEAWHQTSPFHLDLLSGSLGDTPASKVLIFWVFTWAECKGNLWFSELGFRGHPGFLEVSICLILNNRGKSQLCQYPAWWTGKCLKNWTQRLVVSVPNSRWQQVLSAVAQELDQVPWWIHWKPEWFWTFAGLSKGSGQVLFLGRSHPRGSLGTIVFFPEKAFVVLG